MARSLAVTPTTGASESKLHVLQAIADDVSQTFKEELFLSY